MGRKKNATIQGLDPYEALANAVVREAVMDYRSAYRSCARDMANEWRMNEIMRFIHSQWFRELTEIEPEYLIRKLNEERRMWEKNRRIR